ncbi:MAG: hypothetical protein QOI66_3544 [Myxococcales bacterium]|nr:hypothetical protein [Myxococcales bacterium]
MNGKNWTRRQVLKGAGVALSLPVLETFLPDGAKARAATAATKKRYFSVYFPNGTADFWTPSGVGATYTLSPILQPLEPNKAHATVLGNVGNYSPWNGHIEPSHGHNCASAWTGVAANGPGSANNSISIDQAIGDQIIASNGGKMPTPLHSLPMGLSTLDSSPDGIPGQHSRSISWKAADQPLYKIVSPQKVFDTLVGGGVTMTPSTSMPDPNAEKRRALNKSSLDYVLASSADLQKKLSTSDRAKLDQFMTSVRTLENRVSDPTMPVPVTGCTPLARPSQIYGVGMTPANYNRGAHATLMIDLAVMAIQCDITRVVSFMLDDARSDFVYNFINERTFTATGSTPTNKPLGGYHNLQHAGNTNSGFATCGWWMVDRLNELTTKLAAVSDGADGTAIDNTVIHFMSGMHGGNHDSQNLPLVLVGSGGKVLKTGQYIKFPSVVNLQDVHLTILQKVFGSPLTTWGKPMSMYKSGIVPDLLA